MHYYFRTMVNVMNRCHKRDAEELPMRQIFNDVCRTVDAGVNDVAFATIESSMCKRRRTAMPNWPTDPRDADAAITGSRFASLGDAPFYRGSVNTGDGDTTLIFASDGQLELLRSCRLVYVDAPFPGGAFVILSANYGLRPAHRSLVSGAVRSHDPEINALYQDVFEKPHALILQ